MLYHYCTSQYFYIDVYIFSHLVHPGGREEDAHLLRVLLQLPVLLVAEL